MVADSFNKPNGLAFSPDEAILYINDSAAIQGPGTYGGAGHTLFMLNDTGIWAATLAARAPSPPSPGPGYGV